VSAVSTDRWTCPRCQRTTVVSGSEKDTVAALDGVRDRHAAGEHGLEDPAGARSAARTRRADSRAAARRRADRATRRSA
jgi:hypothetical protein